MYVDKIYVICLCPPLFFNKFVCVCVFCLCMHGGPYRRCRDPVLNNRIRSFTKFYNGINHHTSHQIYDQTMSDQTMQCESRHKR